MTNGHDALKETVNDHKKLINDLFERTNELTVEAAVNAKTLETIESHIKEEKTYRERSAGEMRSLGYRVFGSVVIAIILALGGMTWLGFKVMAAGG